MSLYDLKIKRLALLLLPTHYRRPLIAAFAQSMVQGVNIVYGNFMRLRQDKEYRLSHNGQVCHLRAVLNDTFDPVERRILVEDEWSASLQEQRIFQREQERFILIPTSVTGTAFILNHRGFGGVNGFDFWITVPMELRSHINENRLNAVVDTYKLASKRWTINYK